MYHVCIQRQRGQVNGTASPESFQEHRSRVHAETAQRVDRSTRCRHGFDCQGRRHATVDQERPGQVQRPGNQDHRRRHRLHKR
ncbi:hypothetical protein KEN19_CDS0027 [Pseudomonas phage vB_PaePAO1-KEN19]